MAKIVIEVPDELAAVGEAMVETLEALRSTLTTAAADGRAVDYGRIESDVAAKTASIERASHRCILAALDIDLPAVLIGGVRYTRVGRCEAPYHTLAGSVSVERSLYRRSGARGGQPEARTVDAVSLRAGVVGDGWLPKSAKAMAHAVQQGTSREAQATSAELERVPYSRSSFERVAHLVAALTVAAHQDIEDTLIEAYDVPPEAAAVSVSLDRVSIPMEEPRKRPVGRPRKAAPKRPIERNFRMAYCGTVTLHDGKGEALHTIRYGCMPDADIDGMCNRMLCDVRVLRRKSPGLKVQLLCDGAPEMWNLLESRFTTKELGGALYELVDMPHLLEKLGAAAGELVGNHEASKKKTLQRLKLDLLQRDAAAADILQQLEDSGLEQDDPDCPVHAAITYLQRHAVDHQRMNYASARRQGLPVASGNVEATCKSLFELRMKRCGARWKTETGQHILQLRSLALSDRWGPAIELVLRPLSVAVRPAAG